MDNSELLPSFKFCKLCGQLFELCEGDDPGNPPRVLLCSHIFCTNCLQSLQDGNTIKCPECEVTSNLPEDGVKGLQEDDRIVGLIYTNKLNRRRTKRKFRFEWRDNRDQSQAQQHVSNKQVEQALAQGEENLAKLETMMTRMMAHINGPLNTERIRLETEIKLAVETAINAVYKWRNVQLSKVEMEFSSSCYLVSWIKEQMKALSMAIEKANEFSRTPTCKQLQCQANVIEILTAPVEETALEFEGFFSSEPNKTCSFHEETKDGMINLTMKINSKLSKDDSAGGNAVPPRVTNELFVPPNPQPFTTSDSKFVIPDVIVEEVLVETLEPATKPLPAHPEGKIDQNGEKSDFDIKKTTATQWVKVTHVVNPNHFYVHCLENWKETKSLSTKIQDLCSGSGCHFTLEDKVEKGDQIFAMWDDGLWCRCKVLKVFQKRSVVAVKSCPVALLDSVRLLFPDYGFIKCVFIQSSYSTMAESIKSVLEAVNIQLRKMGHAVEQELQSFAPQATKCSLKDLVPPDPSKGWGREVQIEFSKAVSAAAVEMCTLGRDKDFLLVDLMKTPQEQTKNAAISIRDYLVFIEMARLNYPVLSEKKPLTFSLPVYPELNTEYTAVVSHIVDPSDFYIQLADDAELPLLSSKLQEFYTAAPLSAEDDLSLCYPVVGQACVAHYEGENKQWFRAQVIGLPEKMQVAIRDVDFGNSSVLPVGFLRKIKEEFVALPPKAIRCCLADVVPTEGKLFSRKSTVAFSRLVHHERVIVVAKQSTKESLTVKLFGQGSQRDEVDISQILIRKELARPKDRDLPSHPCRLMFEEPDCLANEVVVWDPPLELDFQLELDDLGGAAAPRLPRFHASLSGPVKDVLVKVTFVSSPSRFYVQLDADGSLLKRMRKLLQAECERNQEETTTWRAGALCAATIRGVWERVEIRSVMEGDIAEVKLCDHGNLMLVPISKLRSLPEPLIGSFVLECCLVDISPAGGRSCWTETACDLFSSHLANVASAFISIKEVTEERPLLVSLFCSDPKGLIINAGDFLIEKGLALRRQKPRAQKLELNDEEQSCEDVHDFSQLVTVIPSCIRDCPSPVKAIPKPRLPGPVVTEKVETSPYHPPEPLPIGFSRMMVSAVGDDGLIFLQTQKAENQLLEVREKIELCIKTLPKQKAYNWKFVRGCAVMGDDMLWYRGQLLGVLGGHVKVQYVDYGKVEDIPVVHVYPTLLCADVPQLCVPCQLTAFTPVGDKWQPDAIDMTREMLVGRSVDVEVMEMPKEHSPPFKVDILLDGVSVRRKLCDAEHGFMDAEALPQTSVEAEKINCLSYVNLAVPELGEEFQVAVKHLWTPNEIFLWPIDEAAEENKEALEEALSTLDIESLQQLRDFTDGTPCLAEFNDGDYYRAKLLKITSEDPLEIMVRYVDYGSDDTLPISKLRRIPADLLRFPLQGIGVRVVGFRPPTWIDDEEEVLPYKPEWSMRAALKMTALLHDCVKARVVAKEPEIQVFLYDVNNLLIHLPLVSEGLAELD